MYTVFITFLKISKLFTLEIEDSLAYFCVDILSYPVGHQTFSFLEGNPHPNPGYGTTM